MDELDDRIEDEIKNWMNPSMPLSEHPISRLNDRIDEMKKLMEEQLEVMNKMLEAITQSNGNIISELNRNRDIMGSINRRVGFLM